VLLVRFGQQLILQVLKTNEINCGVYNYYKAWLLFLILRKEKCNISEIFSEVEI